MFRKPKKKSKKPLGRAGRVEQEQRMVKLVQYGTIAIIGIVVLVTLGGFLLNTFYYPTQPVVTINGEEILTKDFKTRVMMERDSLIRQYQLYASFAAQADPSTQQQYQAYLQQIQSQMEPETVGQTVINQMIDEVFIKHEAERRGITVTDQEVTDYLNNLFGYYPNGMPEPTEPVYKPLPTSTLSPTQLALITPTPSPTPIETQEAEEPAGGDTETGEQVQPTPTPTVAAQPEPTSVTQDEYNTSLGDYLDKVKAYGADEAFIRNLIRMQIYRDKLNTELGKDIEPVEEQVWARHILVADEATANDLLQQLKDGADFGQLAIDNSIDTGSGAMGGDLGWFGRGQMVPEFENAAFDGKVGEIVGPVQTDYGFHLIQILGHEMRPVSKSDFDSMVLDALTNLLNDLKTGADIVFANNWIARVPTKPSLFDS